MFSSATSVHVWRSEGRQGSEPELRVRRHNGDRVYRAAALGILCGEAAETSWASRQETNFAPHAAPRLSLPGGRASPLIYHSLSTQLLPASSFALHLLCCHIGLASLILDDLTISPTNILSPPLHWLSASTVITEPHRTRTYDIDTMCNPCSSSNETTTRPAPAEVDQPSRYHTLAQQSFTRIRPDHPDTCYLHSGSSNTSSSGSEKGESKSG